MINSRLPFRTARTSRGGFTLVELLVVIGIIAILAGVALGPITSGIEKAKESSGMQSARSINLLLFSYSNDNNQNYPPGASSGNPLTTAPTAVGTSEGVCIQLLQGGYATDPTIFALTGSTKYQGNAAGFVDFGPANVSWDFTAGATKATGITSSTSDQIPTCYNHDGVAINYPAANAGLSPVLTGAGAFKNNGLAVAYKSNSAVFIKATNTGSGYTIPDFISKACNDAGPFTQLVP